MNVGIMGHRSWLAKSIVDLCDQSKFSVVGLLKSYVHTVDMSQFDVVVLIAGRARPSADEMTAEKQLVADAISNRRHAKRLVYVSSLAAEREDTSYAQTKLCCEQMILNESHGAVVRMPVIFGPNQSPWADMLMPSIARAIASKQPLELSEPMKRFHMVPVRDFAVASVIHTAHDRMISVYSALPMSPLEVVENVASGLEVVLKRGWAKTSNPAGRPWNSKWSQHYWSSSPAEQRAAIEAMVNRLSGSGQAPGA